MDESEFHYGETTEAKALLHGFASIPFTARYKREKKAVCTLQQIDMIESNLREP